MLACCQKLPCLQKGGFTPLKESGAPTGINNYEIHLRSKSGKVTSTVRVAHAVSGQHTITWEDTITVDTKKHGTISLGPGNCN
eukprot:3691250-Prymnesium_polylepis.1